VPDDVAEPQHRPVGPLLQDLALVLGELQGRHRAASTTSSTRGAYR
jgi:hypothetical protein